MCSRATLSRVIYLLSDEIRGGSKGNVVEGRKDNIALVVSFIFRTTCLLISRLLPFTRNSWCFRSTVYTINFPLHNARSQDCSEFQARFSRKIFSARQRALPALFRHFILEIVSTAQSIFSSQPIMATISLALGKNEFDVASKISSKPKKPQRRPYLSWRDSRYRQNGQTRGHSCVI